MRNIKKFTLEKMTENLHQKFAKLFSKYSDSKHLETEYWEEIKKSYTQNDRHYHTLIHLENMINELQKPEIELHDFDSILFSIFYHDIVYKSTAKDNEEKSAEKAKMNLQKIGLKRGQIDKIYDQIMATKFHKKSNDADTNYFLDADLSILGKSWGEFEKYTKNIRKEYSIFPDFLYNPGRRKVLKQFLIREEIFKTEFFKEKYETQAKKNIAKEIESL